MSNKNSDYYFLRGGGEMGELIRAKDWSKTSLGDPADWPQSLCTMVAVMLDNPFGMYIAWGSEYIQLYNDGYRPILGATKHPQALGISTRETFSEIWDNIIGSMFDDVMKGKAVGFPGLMLPLNRNGFVEECYFDFSYSPIRKDNGEVGGVLVTVIETTEKKRATEALKESNARFINNIMQAPVAMCIFRGENYVVEIANVQMLNLWGKHADQVMNKPIFEGLPEAKDQGLETLLDGVFTTGEKFIANERPVNLPRNGQVQTTYINFVYEALKEADGTISGILATAIEVTPQVISRSRVEESEQKVRALVENAPFPIAVYVGKEMIVELANQSIIDIWGKGNDVIGKSFKEVLPELDNQLVFEQIQKVFETGESFHTKNTPLDLLIDGKPYTYYFNYSFTPLYDLNGNIYGVMNTGVDLTELNIAKKRIEESEEQLRIAIEGGEFGTFDFIPKANQLIWSTKTKELFGLPPDARVDYQTYITALHPEDRGTSRAIAQQQSDLKEGGVYELEYRTIGISDGKLRWLRSKGKGTYNKEGEAIRYTGVIQDITKQKEAEEKVRESNLRFRNTMKQAPVGITILRGPEYIVEMANDAYLQLVDKKEAAFVGKPLFTSLPEVEEAIHALLDNVLNTGIPYHGSEVAIPVNRYGKQEVFYFDFLYHPLKEEDGKISGVIAIVTEVSEKVEARKLIEESEERFRNIADSAPVLIWMAGTDKLCYFFNKGWLNFTGRTMEQESGNGWAEGVHPDDLEKCLDVYISCFDKRAPFYMEYRLKRHDGEYRWLSDNGVPRFTSNGEFEGYIGACMDINNEKSHQQKLEESEEKFRLLADSMAQHIWTSDPEGNLNYYNQSVFDYSGLTLEQINKDGWMQIVHPDDREENIKQWVNAVSTGKDFLFEHRFRRYDGVYRWQLSRAIPQKDENGKIQMWVGTSTDIQEQKTFTKELELQVTERTKELEASNIQFQNMNKELQSFAYISSHDLQEPLRKIQTFASRIKEKEKNNLSDSGKDMFNRMQDAAKRMQTLIQDLLAYSRTNITERNFLTTDLNEIIAEVKEDLKEELNEKHATIEANQLCDADIIPFQFRQLMHNLIGNSLKFSNPKNPPHIQIKSEIANGIKFNNEKLSPQNKYCHITVSDNGIGFEQQYSEKIFELFQRLHGKNEYNGTGIGLSIVKKIVENHHGIITAYGDLNKGATFEIYIPTT